MRVPEPVVDYPTTVAFHNHEQCRQESINTSFVDTDVGEFDTLFYPARVCLTLTTSRKSDVMLQDDHNRVMESVFVN